MANVVQKHFKKDELMFPFYEESEQKDFSPQKKKCCGRCKKISDARRISKIKLVKR